MKRTLALVLSVIMTFTLVACGKGDNVTVNEDVNSSTNNTTVSVENDANDANDSKDSKDASWSIDFVKNAAETDGTLFEYTDVDGGISITGFEGDDEIIVIPSSIDGKDVVSIGENAFINNDTMKAVKVSDKVQILESSSFLNCTELEVFVSGAAVKKIGMYTFNGCTKLHEVELNDGLETLDGLCFALTNLTEIEIPSSVTEINYPFTVNYDDHYITVIAERGSTAEQYVNEKGEEYHLIFQAK